MNRLLQDIFKSTWYIIGARIYSLIVYNVLILVHVKQEVSSLILISLFQEFLVSYYGTYLRNIYLSSGSVSLSLSYHALFIFLIVFAINYYFELSGFILFVFAITFILSFSNIIKSSRLEGEDVGLWLRTESILNAVAVSFVALGVIVMSHFEISPELPIILRYLIFSAVVYFYLLGKAYAQIKLRLRFSNAEGVSSMLYIFGVLLLKLTVYDNVFEDGGLDDAKYLLVSYNVISIITAVTIRYIVAKFDYSYFWLVAVCNLTVVLSLGVVYFLGFHLVMGVSVFFILAVWFNLIMHKRNLIPSLYGLANVILCCLWLLGILKDLSELLISISLFYVLLLVLNEIFVKLFANKRHIFN